MRHFAWIALGMLACSGEKPESIAARESPLTAPLTAAFAESATRNHVPRELLLAIATTEGSLDMPEQRNVDPDAEIPVAGPLQLRRGKLDTLARGAALMGVSELQLRRDTFLALEAGARVVAELGAQTGANFDDLTTWSAALEELSGYADAPHRHEYAHRVYAALVRGGARIPSELLAKIELPKLPDDLSHTFGADYTGAEWIPTSCTNKCTPTRSGNPVQYVVIHDTEGGWDASVATLQNDSGKSVHYIIGTDGRLGQFVNETVTAWHDGNFYYNQRSVGIEHVGYSTKPYTEKQYAKSADLLTYLTKKYSIAKDRAHIIGHDQVPNGTKISESAPPCSDAPKACESNLNYGGAGHHTDPGVWEWCTYMPRFGGTCKCNDAYELWNCSYDKTKAMRCVGGKVEVATCNGPGACEAMPLGTADVCHTASATPPPDAGPVDPPDTGAPDTAAPAIADTGTTQPTADTGSTEPAAAPTEDSEMSGGCSTIPGAAPVGAAAALIAVLLALRLARRS